jgi:hypothetical protein
MAEHWNGGNGGKGCKPRPFNIPKDEFDNKFDSIFGEKRTFCDVCGKKFSWCQCVPAPKEIEDAIDKALGIER